MQKPDNKFQLIKPSKAYNIDDIIDVVLAVYRKSWQQCCDLAQSLACDEELATCRAINDYVVENIRYVEDGDKFQHVKTPAKLVDSGFGDCKSIAILVGSCLKCLGIPFVFRFVGFRPCVIRHVYIVTRSGINIDPVECLTNGLPFGEVSTFKCKKDMNPDGLAILSGLPKVGSAAPFKAFLNDTDFLENTRAANYLYSCLDLTFTTLAVEPNDIAAMNDAARLVAAYYLYDDATGDTIKLKRAAHVLQYMGDNGYFNSTSTDDDMRERELENIISFAQDMMASDAVPESIGYLYDWFWNKIALLDFNELSEDDKIAYRNAVAISGIGAASDNELIDQIKSSGGGFLYAIANSRIVKQVGDRNRQVKLKLSSELNVMDEWSAVLSKYMDADTMKNYIVSGCTASYRMTPDKTMSAIASEGGVKISGEIWDAIKDAFKWVWGAIKKAVIWLADLFKKNAEQQLEQQRVEETMNLINEGKVAPAETDITVKANGGSNITSEAGFSFGSFVPLLLIAGAAISIISSKDNK